MAPELWMARLLEEFDRYVDEMARWDAAFHGWIIGAVKVSREELRQIRHEVIELATNSSDELANRFMPPNHASEREAQRCRTCDAAVRMAWGKSPTRRRLRLPPSPDTALTAPATATPAMRHA